MCEYIDMLEAKGEARGEARGFARGEASGEAKGFARGEASGMIKGENRLAQLMQILLKEHRYTELNQIADSLKKRQELYQAYGI